LWGGYQLPPPTPRFATTKRKAKSMRQTFQRPQNQRPQNQRPQKQERKCAMKNALRTLVGMAASLVVGTAWASAQTSTVPQLGHVFIVVGENAGFSQTYQSGAMPYLDSLAGKYGLATNYISDTHGSDFNYFVLSSGQELTFNPTPDPATTSFTVDNIA